MRYNPPPTWPRPPAGWQPPPGWTPDPSWGPPPPGWSLWVPDDAPPAAGTAAPPAGPAYPPGPVGGYGPPPPGYPGPGPGSSGGGSSGRGVALLAVLVVALLVVGGGLLLYSRSGSDDPAASSTTASATTSRTSAAPSRGSSRPRTTTPSPTPTSSRTTTAPDTLEGAFPMITGGTEACGEVPVDATELQVGSAPAPQRAVRCAYTGSPVDGTIYLQLATSADAAAFQTRSLPGSSTRTWGTSDVTNGVEVDHTSPSGVVEQELFYDASRYVAVVRAGPGTDVEQVFQWTVRRTRDVSDMPG